MELNIKGPYELKLDCETNELSLKKNGNGYNLTTVRPLFFIAEDKESNTAIAVSEEKTLEMVVRLLDEKIKDHERPQDEYWEVDRYFKQND